MTARGEISLEQPAVDTLKVILSGHGSWEVTLRLFLTRSEKS